MPLLKSFDFKNGITYQFFLIKVRMEREKNVTLRGQQANSQTLSIAFEVSVASFLFILIYLFVLFFIF